MKVSVGSDVIEINRIKKAIVTRQNQFLDKIFTKAEIDYCESKNVNKYQSYAARFSAKESAFKVFNNKYDLDLNWKDFEILDKDNGKPYLKINNNKIDMSKIEDIDLSLSHSKEYAISNVVVLFKE